MRGQRTQLLFHNLMGQPYASAGKQRSQLRPHLPPWRGTQLNCSEDEMENCLAPVRDWGAVCCSSTGRVVSAVAGARWLSVAISARCMGIASAGKVFPLNEETV